MFHEQHSLEFCDTMGWELQTSAKSPKWSIPLTFYAGCVTSAVVVLGILGALYVKKVEDGCVNVSTDVGIQSEISSVHGYPVVHDYNRFWEYTSVTHVNSGHLADC